MRVFELGKIPGGMHETEQTLCGAESGTVSGGQPSPVPDGGADSGAVRRLRRYDGRRPISECQHRPDARVRRAGARQSEGLFCRRPPPPVGAAVACKRRSARGRGNDSVVARRAGRERASDGGGNLESAGRAAAFGGGRVCSRRRKGAGHAGGVAARRALGSRGKRRASL